MMNVCFTPGLDNHCIQSVTQSFGAVLAFFFVSRAAHKPTCLRASASWSRRSRPSRSRSMPSCSCCCLRVRSFAACRLLKACTCRKGDFVGSTSLNHGGTVLYSSASAFIISRIFLSCSQYFSKSGFSVLPCMWSISACLNCGARDLSWVHSLQASVIHTQPWPVTEDNGNSRAHCRSPCMG